MVIENLLKNREYKLIFLKAILLGIDYGSTNNSDYYRKNIQNEIYKILNNNNDLLNNNNNLLNNNNDLLNNEDIFQKKYENNILNLDNQQKYILNLIQKLSFNYGYNYSKINILKSNLLNINKELEKNKLILKKYRESHKDTISKRDTISQIDREHTNYKYISKDLGKNIPKENLVNELEQTLGNLSNLFIN